MGLSPLGLNSVFAQSYDDLQELENQNSEEDKAGVDSSLQKNYVIIESVSRHNLNPQTTENSADSQILSGLYEGLFSLNPVSMEPQYALAVDYKISRDKKRWTFTLREDACFSNGEKITAESVKFSWIELLKNPGAPFSSLFDVVKGAREFRTGMGTEDNVGIYVNSDNSISIHLVKPAAHLIKLLCHVSFSVIHRNPSVYSGPYEIDDLTNGTVILKKNPFYWDAKNTSLERITFCQSDDIEENAVAFNTGSVDWISSSADLNKLINQKTFQLSAEFGTSYFFFKTSQAKDVKKSDCFNPWDYEEFRNAVLEAFPWEKMRDRSYIPATTFVYPLNGYPTVEGFSYTDEKEAANLMKEAREKYGINENQKLPLVFEISENYLSDSQINQFKESMESIGVELIVKTVPVYEYLIGVKKSDSDLFSYTWIGDFADPLAFLELFRGDSTLNDSGWKNEKYDLLLEKASFASDAERYEILAEAENLLLDSGMVLPISRPVSINIINLEENGGWAANPFDLHPLKYLFKRPSKINLPNIL